MTEKKSIRRWYRRNQAGCGKYWTKATAHPSEHKLLISTKNGAWTVWRDIFRQKTGQHQAISVGILERQMRQFWMEGVSTRWFEPEYRSGFVNSFSNNRPLVAQPLNLRNHEDLYYWTRFYGQAGPWVTRILTKRGYEMELWVYIQAFYDFNEKKTHIQYFG